MNNNQKSLVPCVLRKQYTHEEQSIFHMLNEGGPIYDSGRRALEDATNPEHRPRCQSPDDEPMISR